MQRSSAHWFVPYIFSVRFWVLCTEASRWSCRDSLLYCVPQHRSAGILEKLSWVLHQSPWIAFRRIIAVLLLVIWHSQFVLKDHSPALWQNLLCWHGDSYPMEWIHGGGRTGRREGSQRGTDHWFAFNVSIKRLKRIKCSLEGLISCITPCNCAEVPRIDQEESQKRMWTKAFFLKKPKPNFA